MSMSLDKLWATEEQGQFLFITLFPACVSLCQTLGQKKKKKIATFEEPMEIKGRVLKTQSRCNVIRAVWKYGGVTWEDKSPTGGNLEVAPSRWHLR